MRDEIIGNSIIIVFGILLILIPYWPIYGGIAIGVGWSGINHAGLSAQVADALQELQQLREERSWRDIGELNEASAPQFFQLRDKANVNPMPFWLMDGILCTWAEDQDGIGDVSIEMAQEWYTHWRPLPMDLPEVE